jgi:hypothetical protein
VVGVFDLSFPGRLGGEAHSDIYFGRVAAQTTGGSVGQPLSGFLDLPMATGEPLVAQGQGTYGSSGVAWDTSQPIELSIVTPSNPTGTILVNTAATTPAYQVNPNTGIIAADNTVLGGKVYLNPSTGIVQFTNGSFAANVTVSLTYVPRLLRVSSGSVSAEHPVVLYDNRVDSNLSYWCTAGNAAETTPQPDDRYDFIYTAPSTGAGQAARMYMSTYRLGLILPQPVQTYANNNQVVSLIVTGNNGPYQIDPAKGRVYFTDADEGNSNIGITYSAISASGNVSSISLAAGGAIVSWMNESPESAVPLDSSVNEGQVSAFLDPFDQNVPAIGVPRPGIIWLFWTSTRNGGPDVFFETIAPNFTPVVQVQQ